MFIAKIIRHRHQWQHLINDHLKDVREVVYFKILFSHPIEMGLFEEWVKENGGSYNYDKENSCQFGEMPNLKEFKEDVCWCDIMTFYLMNVAGYNFHSTIHPYKGEVYTK